MRLAAGLLLLAVPQLAAPAEDAPTPPTEEAAAARPVVGARLAWLSMDALDLVGDAWADVPFWSSRRHHGFFALDVRTTIEGTSNSFDFVLRDIDYGAHLGWRLSPARGPLGAVSAFAGQRGKALVDRDGDRFVRYVAVELQSRAFRRTNHSSWFEWNAAAGPVIDERGIDADAWVAGSLRLDVPRSGGPEIAPRAARFGFDLRVNGLWMDGGLEADVTLGPHLLLPTGSGRTAVLFVHYQWSDNPLGLGADTWLVGLEYVEDSSAPVAGGTGPDIYAWIGAGAGLEERLAGTLLLRALTPLFARRYRGAGVLEINALAGRIADELFYRYDLGIERVFDHGVAGIYFYHRSNHVLAEQGPGITSINVLEGGWETREWYRIGTRQTVRRWGTLDFRARAGWLVESTFGEDRGWHVRGGVRWTTPIGPGRSQLFARIGIEEGDVGTRSLGVGLATGERLEFEAAYLDDDQHFGDTDAALLNLRYAF